MNCRWKVYRFLGRVHCRVISTSGLKFYVLYKCKIK